jgi:hypothetical protein
MYRMKNGKRKYGFLIIRRNYKKSNTKIIYFPEKHRRYFWKNKEPILCLTSDLIVKKNRNK